MSQEFETFLRVLDQYIEARFRVLDAQPRFAARAPSILTGEQQKQVEMKAGDLEVCFNKCLVTAVRANYAGGGELRRLLREDLASLEG